jgi:hypothetical protein
MTNQQEYIRLCSIPAVQEKIREGMGMVADWLWKEASHES